MCGFILKFKGLLAKPPVGEVPARRFENGAPQHGGCLSLQG
jgi:hypothetical protein